MTMIEVKTADLAGLALDWAVGIADGRDLELPSGHRGRTCIVWCDPFVIKREGFPDFHDKTRRHWKPSTQWGDGGPLVEKFAVKLVMLDDCIDGETPGWVAEAGAECTWESNPNAYIAKNGGEGLTPLVAVCRAIVRAKSGDTIQVPEELMP